MHGTRHSAGNATLIGIFAPYLADYMESLAELKIGERAKIVGFAGEDIPARFYEMGLLPGIFIEMKYQAPFNGPMGIHIDSHSYLLALRRKEARYVYIERADEGN
jgi:ferrous iron transport protein A